MAMDSIILFDRPSLRQGVYQAHLSVFQLFYLARRVMLNKELPYLCAHLCLSKVIAWLVMHNSRTHCLFLSNLVFEFNSSFPWVQNVNGIYVLY